MNKSRVLDSVATVVGSLPLYPHVTAEVRPLMFSVSVVQQVNDPTALGQGPSRPLKGNTNRPVSDFYSLFPEGSRCHRHCSSRLQFIAGSRAVHRVDPALSICCVRTLKTYKDLELVFKNQRNVTFEKEYEVVNYLFQYFNVKCY